MRYRPHLALAALLFAGAVALTTPCAFAAPRVAAVALQDTTQGLLPYVDFITICGQNKCDPAGQTICSTDSLVIQIGGHFPNGCFSFDRIELLPMPRLLPPSPGIFVIVSDGSCTGSPTCPDSLVPWSAQIVLPPSPSGMFTARVDLGVTACPGGQPATDTMTTVPFTVAQCETVPSQTCLLGRWQHAATGPLCDASVSEGHPAHVTFIVNSTVPLAALQGTFTLSPNTLKITNVETTGPAVGMNLQCSLTSTGAKFVLFSTSGTPIPAAPPTENRGTLGTATEEDL